MALSRIRQEDEELRDSLPYHWLKGLAQNEEKIGIVIPPRVAPARHRHGEHFCYCPSPDCGYQMSVEEGQKCNLIECPLCGTRMRAVSTGEYRISQAEPVPVAPLLVTFGLISFLAYMIVKRPFG